MRGTSANIRYPMRERWTDRLPPLRGEVTTLREVAASDVQTLFTLFSDPAVTTYMAPPPPTLAKFAGFVLWSREEREHGHGFCFGIVPDGMTAAVGILQVRSLDSTLSTAEWGFVLSAHFWSTGVFFDSANALLEFAFSTMQVNRLEARIAVRNRRAHAAVQKLGARFESTVESSSQTGIPRDPEFMWTLCEQDWRNRTRDSVPAHDAKARVDKAVDAAEKQLRQREAPDTVDPYPLFLFDRRRRE
jgi:RimJ/RimL family protein N-acetyltransferase